MKIIVTGGGTGGHIYPAIAIAQAVKETEPGHEVLYAGSTDGMESKIAPDAGLTFQGVTARKLRKVISLDTFQVIFSLFKGYGEAKGILKRFHPDVVVGTGGYVAAAVVLAAANSRIPTIIVEENAIPGRTNLWLSQWATRICVGFEKVQKEFPAHKTLMTGVPIRNDILSEATKPEARKLLELDANRFTILALGGSQGAQKLNEVVAEMACATQLPIQILHQVGDKNFDDFRSKWGKSIRANSIVRHRPLPFLNQTQIPLAYRATDLVICRCGASTLAEITACGLPSLMVPLPTAYADHQTANASAIAKAGGGVLLPQVNLTAKLLEQQIKSFYDDKNRLCEMANASKKIGRPDAAKIIAELALGLASS
jgi:UDP-N-acetylglucosamine--N-acetylmuramyl-(pentapeptide) pyrophosphoryl-undecaprenol N-acetylglucosamine transferase